MIKGLKGHLEKMNRKDIYQKVQASHLEQTQLGLKLMSGTGETPVIHRNLINAKKSPHDLDLLKGQEDGVTLLMLIDTGK